MPTAAHRGPTRRLQEPPLAASPKLQAAVLCSCSWCLMALGLSRILQSIPGSLHSHQPPQHSVSSEPQPHLVERRTTSARPATANRPHGTAAPGSRASCPHRPPKQPRAPPPVLTDLCPPLEPSRERALSWEHYPSLWIHGLSVLIFKRLMDEGLLPDGFLYPSQLLFHFLFFSLHFPVWCQDPSHGHVGVPPLRPTLPAGAPMPSS